MSELNKVLEETNVEKLQKFLNKCIELGRKPRGHNYSGGHWDSHNIDEDFVEIERINKNGVLVHYTYTYHDLFSKNSGLLDFVKRKDDAEYRIVRQDVEDTNHEHDRCYDTEPQYHYMIMGPMTAEEKVSYFLKNSLFPTLPSNETY